MSKTEHKPRACALRVDFPPCAASTPERDARLAYRLQVRVYGPRKALFFLIPSGALEQRLPPGLVLDVPLNGFVESFVKIAPRFPVQLTLRKRGINRIPAVVSKPVGYKRNQAVRLTQLIEDHFYDIDVHHLAVASEVINRPWLPLEQRGDNRGAMICHVDPIAHIHAVAIDRERLVTERFDNHERNQFFRELIRAVVVRAARHEHFLAIGFVGGEREKVGAGFACRIWRARIDRGLLGEFARRAERAIDFVCGDLDEALSAVAPRAIKQHTRADDICVDEIERRIDAAVDMRFGSEIHDRVKLMLGHEGVHLVGVGDIGFEKLVAFGMFLDHAIEIGEIACVSKHIDVGHVRWLVMLQNIPNKVAPDEPTATGYEKAHCSAY
jgi:hypothetical protein